MTSGQKICMLKGPSLQSWGVGSETRPIKFKILHLEGWASLQFGPKNWQHTVSCKILLEITTCRSHILNENSHTEHLFLQCINE